MFNSRNSLLLGLITLLSPLGAAVQAQDNGLGFAYLYGYGASNTSGIRSYVPAPPYFALHPPVYYGQRYTRPYGESPFASWPQLRSPANYQPKPAANYAPAIVLNVMPASAPQVVPVPPAYSPAHESYPAPAASPAPAAPVAPAAAPSPVVHTLRPVAPLIVENPYYPAKAARLVANPPLN